MNHDSIYILFNGELYNAGDKLFDSKNRAFAYGDGLFETMHAYGTTVKHLSKHIERLYRGMKVLGMVPHEKLLQPVLERDIQKLLNRNKFFGSTRIRLTVYRDSGGFYTPTSIESSYIITTEPLNVDKYEINNKGYVIDVYPDMQKTYSILSAFKTCNSLLYVLAGKYAKENGLNESIIMNPHGFIVETTASNIFAVKDNVIITPALTDGCIEGVMRSVVCEIVENGGFKLYTNIHLTIEHLLEADEVFVTNAIKGIQWIVAFKERRYYNKVSRSLIESLNKYSFC